MIYKILNINFIFLIGIGLFFLCQSSFSQSPDWMSEHEINTLKEINLTYNKPNKFDEIIGVDSFENNPALKKILWSGRNQLRSKGNHFIVFNKINNIVITDSGRPVFQFNTSSRLSQIEEIPYISKSTVTQRYILSVKEDIRILLGEKYVVNWEGHVNYYSKKQIESKFNADTAISYSINLQPKDYYEGKYNNLWVLYIEKEFNGFNRLKELKGEEEKYKRYVGYEKLKKLKGYVRVYCFYKDMSKRKLAKYKAEVEHIFRFKD